MWTESGLRYQGDNRAAGTSPHHHCLPVLSPHLHSICPIRTASREHSLCTGLGSCCALPQLPLVTKAACWPTTSHSNPVITPCLQGRKGREGRKKKGQHPEKEQSHLKIAEPFQGEKGSLTHTQGLPSTSQHQWLLHEAAHPFLGR